MGSVFMAIAFVRTEQAGRTGSPPCTALRFKAGAEILSAPWFRFPASAEVKRRSARACRLLTSPPSPDWPAGGGGEDLRPCYPTISPGHYPTITVTKKILNTVDIRSSSLCEHGETDGAEPLGGASPVLESNVRYRHEPGSAPSGYPTQPEGAEKFSIAEAFRAAAAVVQRHSAIVRHGAGGNQLSEMMIFGAKTPQVGKK